MPTQDAWKRLYKELCAVTGAAWIAWLSWQEERWRIAAPHLLTKKVVSELESFLNKTEPSRWLAGALGNGRMRWCSAEKLKLGCPRLYIFPNVSRHQVLIVGSPPLTAGNLAIFKATALIPAPGALQQPAPDSSPGWDIRAELESSYNPQDILDHALDYLAKLVGCEAAYLAIRQGNLFRIQSAWNCTRPIKNIELSLSAIRPLEQIAHTRKGVILTGEELERWSGLPALFANSAQAWMGVPILVSKRVVGIAAFVTQAPSGFTPELMQKTADQATHLAYHIENAIIFSEATRYLEQMTLLNELASTVSMSVELNEVSRRMMQRLRRTFDIDWAAVFLLTPEGDLLREYGGSGRSATPREVPVKNTLVGYTVTHGTPIRINDLRLETRFQPLEPGFGCELAVPLKYQGRIIGAIDLVSKEANAFSAQDEQLLILIAGHLAGLFENMRLNQEAQDRAQKLQDTVLELRAVRETALDITSALELDTLLTRIARRATVLVDARGAELGLLNEKEQAVEIVVSLTPWQNMQGLQIPFMAGVAGRMAVFGEPVIISDYNAWSGRLFPEQTAPFKSTAGVPLIFKGEVIGTLTVMDDRPERSFSEEDVRLLELLAPQAAISIRNAQLYQELQERIAAQQRAESNLVRSARLAAVGEMAAGIAHELNNPLTTVTGFVELALEELPPDYPLRGDLELALQEALRARDVVRRLLDFSRPTEFRRSRTDLRELVNQVVSLTSHLMRTSGVHLSVQHPPDLPWALVDSSQIQQVLLNLTHNALNAMPSGGSLTIRTAAETREGTNWILLQVIDTGEGIPPEHMERIFQPFFTTRPQNKGTGLGLSVSYGIVQSHGGFIEVNSQVGKGSTFSVYLPVASEEEG